ncbi:hypothetical protein LDENG_00188340 [Lucifuga dentata]|nr:hypothetical protein LDENG_00188340 [Lucifuga dentata]
MESVRAIALLCLVSVSFSAPLTCKDLIQPVDHLDLHQLEGIWALVAGSLNHSAALENMKLRDSITVNIYNSSGNSRVSYTQINRFGDRCQYLYYNMSVQGSTFTFDAGKRFNLSGSFLYTSCPDCLVVRWDVESRRRVSLDLYLLSRRREVELKEMEEYRAQLKCLDLPSAVVMDPTKELCPEQAATEPAAAQTEENAEKQKD